MRCARPAFAAPFMRAGATRSDATRPKIDPRVYLVTDPRIPPNRTMAEIVTLALRGHDDVQGATVVQFRDKRVNDPAREFDARIVRAATAAAGTLMLVNDDLQLARSVHADGVHVGQDDAGVSHARDLLGPDAIVGVSAGTVDEALRAVDDGADYLGVGAVFATATKGDAGAPIGPHGLREIVAAVEGAVPVVAIGGIQCANAAVCRDAGADGVAVVSAIMRADQPDRAASALFKVWT